jgi:hypothetical protein
MANLRRRIPQQTESLFTENHEPFFNSIGQSRQIGPTPTTTPSTPPLSKIPITPNRGTTLPVCAVFTMDADGTKIMNLALYGDRWKTGQDLWDKNNPPHIDK